MRKATEQLNKMAQDLKRLVEEPLLVKVVDIKYENTKVANR